MRAMKRSVLALLLVSLAWAADAPSDKVLVYTRNGKGYVHDNIATSVEALKELGASNRFGVDASDDPKLFTAQNLKQYKAIIFSNSNNEIFDDDQQRDALRSFVQAGGGVVGIHIATGSERNWPYFWSLMGGKFVRHPKLQKFNVLVRDRSHPATASLPESFEWEDECYLFQNMNPDVKVLLAADPSKVDDPKRAESPGQLRDNLYPLSWYNTFDGGRQYYLSLGHKKEHYADPIFRQQLLAGILWTMKRN